MNVKTFLKKYIIDNVLVMIFWLLVMAFACWTILETYDKLASNALRNYVKILINSSVLIYFGVVKLFRIIPMVIDVISGCKTKKIEFFAENVFAEKFHLTHKLANEIKAKLPNRKKLILIHSRDICIEKVEKGFYYTAIVTKHSNAIIELTKGKETKGNWQK